MPKQVSQSLINILNIALYVCTEADIKLQVFTEYYAKLANILPIRSLTHYFVKDKVISSDEEKTILQKATQSEGARTLLRKIGGSLEAHLTTSFNKLLSIMEQHGDISCVDLINEMKQDLPQDTTGKLPYLHKF